MMLIKLLLLLLVLIIAVYFLRATNRTRTQAWQRILFSLFVTFMAIAIIFPETTNRVANAVGVGRGADLVLYTLAIAFVFVAISVYIKFKDYEQRITELARKMAITEAKNREAQKGRKH